MRVLIASHSLAHVGGVQAYERDLAFWLIEQGHTPIVYSPFLGETARQLERRTVAVTDDLTSVSLAPDIIHGDSAVETMTALLHFPEVPAVFVCHGWLGPLAAPPRFPRVLRYVAVDETCADRLLLREGIAPDKVSVVLNGVDLTRFRQRPPLPPTPRRAVVFSNTAHESNYLPIVREACRRAGIGVDVVGYLSGESSPEPETILPRYDLAFAKAKCAIEAMACGLAVVLCDTTGTGGMVRSSEVDRLRRLNFGMRTLDRPISVEAVMEAIRLYDPVDARKISDRIRDIGSCDMLCRSLFEIYESVLVAHAAERSPNDWQAESRAAAAFLRRNDRALHKERLEGNEILQAAHRLLQFPLIGPAGRRAINWLRRRRR
jgi:glycosyltransferase involved in cell wall biosynthesis